MADHIEVDFTEVMRLADDFDAVAVGLAKLIPKAVEVSARNIKDRARAAVQGRRHFAQAASAIDYELLGFQGFGSTVVDAEIGYNKGRGAGALGNLIEYGAPNAKAHMLVYSGGKATSVPVPGGRSRPLAPGGELQAALDAEEDEFVIQVEAAVAKAMNEYWL